MGVFHCRQLVQLLLVCIAVAATFCNAAPLVNSTVATAADPALETDPDIDAISGERQRKNKSGLFPTERGGEEADTCFVVG